MWRPMSRLQRDWVVRRDGNRCQKFVFVNGRWLQCKEKRDIQVHHIYCKRAMELWSPDVCPHTPDNLLSLCRCHHVSEDGVHQDAAYALKNYRRGDKDAFKKMFAERELKLQRGQIYWNSQWDILFLRRAAKMTARYLSRKPNDTFPQTLPLDESE